MSRFCGRCGWRWGLRRRSVFQVPVSLLQQCVIVCGGVFLRFAPRVWSRRQSVVQAPNSSRKFNCRPAWKGKESDELSVACIFSCWRRMFRRFGPISRQQDTDGGVFTIINRLGMVVSFCVRASCGPLLVHRLIRLLSYKKRHKNDPRTTTTTARPRPERENITTRTPHHTTLSVTTFPPRASHATPRPI